MADLVWGIDVATARIAFASTLGGYTQSVDLEDAAHPARLSSARRMVRDFAADMAGDHPPLYVWVEAPTGKFVKPSLLHAVGVTIEAVYSALEHRWNFPVTVDMIGVSSWKARSVGRGHATKAEVMEWAKTVGSPANQDEADALGIAFGGLAMMGDQGAAAA